MQSITVANTGSSTTWTNVNPEYKLSFGGVSTACLPYNAEDWEWEV